MDGGLPIREFRPSKEPARDPNSPLRAAAAAAAAEEAERARDAAAQREVVADASQAASGVARATALRALAASGRVSAVDAVGLYGTSRRGFFCTAGDAAARHQALEAARAVVARGDAGDAGAVLDMAAAALGPEAGEGDADALKSFMGEVTSRLEGIECRFIVVGEKEWISSHGKNFFFGYSFIVASYHPYTCFPSSMDA